MINLVNKTYELIQVNGILYRYISLTEPVVQPQEMSFQDISHLELWRPLWSAEPNHMCNFGREHFDEQFCENISISTSDSEEDIV